MSETTPKVAPLTAEEVAKKKANHYFSGNFSKRRELCHCTRPMPCEAQRFIATIEAREAEVAALRAALLCPRHRWEDYEVGETPQDANGHTSTIRITACSRCGLWQDKGNVRAATKPEGAL
jgi:hypothetical protein